MRPYNLPDVVRDRELLPAPIDLDLEVLLVLQRIEELPRVRRARRIAVHADHDVARLEAELGVALFTRPGRSIRLTRHGRQLLEAAERAMGGLAGPLARLTSEAHPGSGRERTT